MNIFVVVETFQGPRLQEGRSHLSMLLAEDKTDKKRKLVVIGGLSFIYGDCNARTWEVSTVPW